MYLGREHSRMRKPLLAVALLALLAVGHTQSEPPYPQKPVAAGMYNGPGVFAASTVYLRLPAAKAF